jgi:hypothetical protein
MTAYVQADSWHGHLLGGKLHQYFSWAALDKKINLRRHLLQRRHVQHRRCQLSQEQGTHVR